MVQLWGVPLVQVQWWGATFEEEGNYNVQEVGDGKEGKYKSKGTSKEKLRYTPCMQYVNSI